uniref:Uncharacterized protein n=1 Tax=Anguilla anguilla TaxID=7936 RepID=A0A0E9RK16_ANGAN
MCVEHHRQRHSHQLLTLRMRKYYIHLTIHPFV